MRRTVGLTLAVCLFLAAVPVRADEAPEARALLDRAIKAMGGADKLTQLQAVTWKGKGTIEAGSVKADFTDEWSAQGDTHYRWELDITVEGRMESGVLVISKDKGWLLNKRGRTGEMPKEIHALLTADFRVLRLAERLVAMKDRAYQLSALGELKIKDRAAVGIKVTHKDRPDIDLFFDKETGLPVRAEVRVKEGRDGQEVLHSLYFSDYKEVNGVKHFTKASLRRDDKPAIDLELTEVQLHEKLDDSLFEKP